MDCNCSNLNRLVDVSDISPDFENNLTEISEGNWVKLMRCPSCGQLWRVDVWDKLQIQFAVKLDSEDGWEHVDTTALQKQFLLESRGGNEEGTSCIWAGCDLPAVKGVVYCIEHLYKTGARK